MEIEVIDDMEDAFYAGVPAEAPVTDLEKAEAAIHRIVMASSRISDAEARVKELKARADKWLAEVTDDANKVINPALAALKPWATNQIADAGTKTVKTMTGNVKFRTIKGKTVDNDKAKTLEWYKLNYPELVRATTTYKLDVEKAKSLFRDTGEDPECKAPTIEFLPQSEKMYVEEV